MQIAEFNQLHFGLSVNLQVEHREFVLSALVDNSTDLAITDRPPESLDVVAQHFMDNPLVVIAAPGHALAALPVIPLKRMAEEALVVREPGSGTRGRRWSAISRRSAWPSRRAASSAPTKR